MSNLPTISDREVTPPELYFNRRAFMQAATVAGTALATASVYRWFNPATKEFVKNVVDEQTEVISMMGNITEEHGKAHLHAHVVLGTRNASAKGGHLVAGWVSPTLEVIIEEAPEHMKRGKDRKSGLILLKP